MQLGPIVIRADVSALHWGIRGQRSLALLRVNDHDSVREVAERARVIDVQMGLDDVRYIPGSDPELPQLGFAVLFLAHVNFEHVCQRAPTGVRITRDRERVAAVDEDEAAGMTEQEEQTGTSTPPSARLPLSKR
jgi:hypothetical protein